MKPFWPVILKKYWSLQELAGLIFLTARMKLLISTVLHFRSLDANSDKLLHESNTELTDTYTLTLCFLYSFLHKRQLSPLQFKIQKRPLHLRIAQKSAFWKKQSLQAVY